MAVQCSGSIVDAAKKGSVGSEEQTSETINRTERTLVLLQLLAEGPYRLVSGTIHLKAILFQ